MENTTQEEILEETEQEGLVEAPEAIEEDKEEIVVEASKKVKEDDDEDDEKEDDDDEEEEEDEQVKKEEVKVPSTKSAMIKALFDKVNGLKKEEVSAKWKNLMDVAEAEDLGGETVDDAKPEGDTGKIGKKKKKLTPSDAEKSAVKIPEINVKEDIEALVQGEELSEEFKSKASTIFEAAVYQKVMEVATKKTEELEEEYTKNLQEEIITFRDELTEKVDGYLNYVVEEWMKVNELALDSSLRSEITEEFIGGLKGLFQEHYIEVPDEKVDMVENLFDRVEELETKLNGKIEENVKVTNELNEYRKNKIVEEVSNDLADTQSEKLKTLTEGVSIEKGDVEDFESKVKQIKESYFPSQVKKDEVISEEGVSSEDQEETPVKMNNIMEAYSHAIARN